MPLTPANPSQLGSDGTPCGDCGSQTLPPPIALTSSASILRKQRQTDDYGTSASVWNTLYPSISCRIFHLDSVTERVQSDQQKSVEKWRAYFAIGTDVLPSDRVNIDGALYEVTGSDSGLSGATVLTVYLVEIDR